MKYFAALLLLACASPAVAVHAPPKGDVTAQSGKGAASKDAKKAGDDFDMGQLFKMFDAIFPPQPAPPPERLALARTTAAGVLPDGTYAAMFEELMSGLVERVLALKPADLGDKKSKDPGLSLREQIAKDDPHFEERMRITRRVIGEELVRLSAVMEPRLRDGLARALARKLDETQLREINAFLATDSGRAFGSHSMRMWMDPDVMRSMVQAFPDMVMAMPGAMKRLEAETAHLPKPKTKKGQSAAGKK